MERPEIAMPLEAIEGQQLFEAVAWRVVDRVTLRNVLEVYSIHGGRNQ